MVASHDNGSRSDLSTGLMALGIAAVWLLFVIVFSSWLALR